MKVQKTSAYGITFFAFLLLHANFSNADITFYNDTGEPVTVTVSLGLAKGKNIDNYVLSDYQKLYYEIYGYIPITKELAIDETYTFKADAPYADGSFGERLAVEGWLFTLPDFLRVQDSFYHQIEIKKAQEKEERGGFPFYLTFPKISMDLFPDHVN